MRTRALGKSGIEASVIAFGAWAIGGWMWGGTEERDAIAAVQAAVDEGITLIDTAAIYGMGRSEEIVGKAIAGRRDKVVLATKCGLRWDLRQGELHFYSDDKGIAEGDAGTPVYKYLNPESIRWEVEQSLRRLKTDVIDLYQTHWQENTTAVEDTMAELLSLKDQGKIRSIGASNVTVDHIRRYLAAGQLDAVQNRYSMLDRADAAELLPFCQANNVAYLAYSPMAMGLLTGKISPDRVFGQGDIRARQPRFSVENRQRVQTLLSEFKPIADGRGLTMAQLVMAWTAEQPGLTHVLAGARNPQQAKENAKAGTVELTNEELAAMDAAIEKCAGLLV